MLHSVSINDIMPCIIDVYVINAHHHHREKEEGQTPFIRELDDSHVDHVLAIAPLYAYIMNSECQPHSVMVDSDKNRLVVIPSSHQMRPLQGFCSTSNTAIASKEGNMHFCVNCECAIGMYELQFFVASIWRHLQTCS